jgi:hypothetical protein
MRGAIPPPQYIFMTWCLIKQWIVFVARHLVKHRDNCTYVLMARYLDKYRDDFIFILFNVYYLGKKSNMKMKFVEFLFLLFIYH